MISWLIRFYFCLSSSSSIGSNTYSADAESLTQESKMLKILENSESKNEIFNCKGKPQISRFPDTSDCSKFIYCVSGSPYTAKCYPPGTRFNPLTMRCDLPPNIQCGSPLQQLQNKPISVFIKPQRPPPLFQITPKPPTVIIPIPGKPVIEQKPVLMGMTSSPEFTERTTTTEKPPRLNDKFEFTLNCSKVGCGFYPNHNANCSTYIVCSKGVKTIKQCHGGLLFDTTTSECRKPGDAKCWEEPHNGPYVQSQRPPKLCNFHNISNSKNIAYENNITNAIVLSNPQVTNWGTWQTWKECPEGSYIRGINAWRRLLKQGSATDHAGLISIALSCETPDGKQTSILESIAPGAPNDGWANFYRCDNGGEAVGFRLNSQQKQLGGRDNIATDNVQLICSCGTPVYKPYENIPGEQSGNRGDWTDAQICGPKQALCGMRTQMVDYREAVVGEYDNTGLNNMKVKCCNVSPPTTICDPSEQLLLIRSCSNTEGIYPSRCDFEILIGTTYDFESSVKINFYESIGYNLQTSVDLMNLKKTFESFNRSGSEFSWNDSNESVLWKPVNHTLTNSGTIYLQPNTTTEIHQIMGICNPFIVRTNRYIRTIMDLNDGNVVKSYFEI